jgi:hypothetical protein
VNTSCPLNDTEQAPALAQINVTPSMLLIEIGAVQEYEPAAKVIVAPSLALFSAACTSDAELPAVQLQDVAEPEHVACRTGVHPIIVKASPTAQSPLEAVIREAKPIEAPGPWGHRSAIFLSCGIQENSYK